MKAANYPHSFTFLLVILCTSTAAAMSITFERLLSFAIDKTNPILCHTIPLRMYHTLITEHINAENKINIHVNIPSVNTRKRKVIYVVHVFGSNSRYRN